MSYGWTERIFNRLNVNLGDSVTIGDVYFVISGDRFKNLV